MANNIVVWGAQSGQMTYWNLTSTGAWITNESELVNRLLRSLAQAEDYLKVHPDDSKAIVQKRLNYDDSYISSVWPQHRFSLSLDQTLIVAMKDEAQWMINSNLTSEKTLPDFVDYIYLDGLKAVKPEVVNIIR
jgi:NitT/TauT family transport system substrate-binding protein